MIWVGWRQQRWETIVAAAMLAAVAALLVPTGIAMLSAYHHDGVAACVTAPQGGPCDPTLNAFHSRFDHLGNLIAWFTLLPGIIGVLLAAPFVSELEHGTYRLDWTQGITRRRWIAGKLGLAVATAIGASVIFIALVTWWRTPLVHVQGRMETSVFDSEGIVAIGYTLFALGLATALGTVWRRAVPALISGFAIYFAARLFFDTWVRQRLVSPLQLTFPAQNGPNLNRDWILSQFASDRHGHAIDSAVVCGHGAAGACSAPASGKGAIQYFHVLYHPPSHFWPLQVVEFAIFGGVAACLLGFAAWWTARRIA